MFPNLDLNEDLIFAIIKPGFTDSLSRAAIIDFMRGWGWFIEFQFPLEKLSKEFVEKLYYDNKDKDYFQPNNEYMTSGNVILLVLSSKTRSHVKTENLNKFKKALRNGFGKNQRENAVHISDSLESAKDEIELLMQFMNQ